MKAEIRSIVGLLPLMLLSMALLSLLVRGSGVLAYRSFQSPTSPPPPPRPSRSWADYIEIGLVALAYRWRALGVLALIAFLGLVISLAIGAWRS